VISSPTLFRSWVRACEDQVKALCPGRTVKLDCRRALVGRSNLWTELRIVYGDLDDGQLDDVYQLRMLPAARDFARLIQKQSGPLRMSDQIPPFHLPGYCRRACLVEGIPFCASIHYGEGCYSFWARALLSEEPAR
jgi:hypothetical protein